MHFDNAELIQAIDTEIAHRQPKQEGSEIRFLCPSHDDHHPSARWNPEKQVWCCDACGAKGGRNDLAKAFGIQLPSSNGHTKPKRQIAATYDYTDVSGNLLFQAVRYQPKDFAQRQPDGNGGWIYDLKGVTRVLYRLPELIAADASITVYLVEGEKDADRLAALGLVATTNPMGAGKWLREYSKWLKDRHVAILPDNDEPGRKHAQKVAASLLGVAASVKIVELPGLPEKGDASDWLNAGGTRDELEKMAAEATALEASTSAPTSGQHFNLTDYGNAERLASRHGADLRYCHDWGAWFVWDGKRWRKDATAEVVRRAKATARAIYAEASEEGDDNARKAVVEWAKKTEARERLTAMIGLAASEPDIPVTPDQLDAGAMLLNCMNGTVDLQTGELRPHRREDLITKLAPAEYRADAKAPTWDKFLERVLPDPDVRAFVQRAVGYSLTGDTSEQCLFFCHGSGSNGKSTMLRLLLDLLKEYAKQAAPELLTFTKGDRHPTEIADLLGARLVATIETDEGKRMAEALVKQMTGGDLLKGRFMRQDFFQFEPTFKLWLAANHKPVIRGTDYAIWRRIHLIPFTVTIDESEKDPKLPAKLRGELPGILAWAVRGCLDWQSQGLKAPEGVKKATADYRAEMDTIADFIEECCIVTPKATATIKELYSSYQTWAEASGEKAMSKKAFGIRLDERGFQTGHNAERTKRVRTGIGLRANTDNPPDTFSDRTHPDTYPDIAEAATLMDGLSEGTCPDVSGEQNVSGGASTTLASVPTMITRQMQTDLLARGYSQERIDELKPEEAWAILDRPFIPTPADLLTEAREHGYPPHAGQPVIGSGLASWTEFVNRATTGAMTRKTISTWLSNLPSGSEASVPDKQ